MRHYFALSAPGAIPGLAGRMPKPAGAALLIAMARPLQRDPPRAARAGVRAVALSAVAEAAQEEELPAVRSDADDQPQRIHMLPRSGRGGWTTTGRCAKKGAAKVALPRVISPEGPGWSDSGPSPLSAVGGKRSTSTHLASQPLGAGRSRIPRFLVTVNTLLLHHEELAGPSLGQPCGHREPDRGDDHADGPPGAGSARYAPLSG